ncbi:MAG: ComEC/Rec2 family competence protein [Weeksellaceae bacterium]
MKFQPFAFLTLALAIGILLEHYWDFETAILFYCGGVVLTLMIFQKIIGKFRLVFTVLGLVLIGILGILRYNQINETPPENLSTEPQLLELRVIDIYKPSAKYYKYKTKVLRARDSALIGENILFYLKKSQQTVHQQDVLLSYGKTTIIPIPSNPHQFDYERFLKFKGIHIQTFADTLTQLKHPPRFSFTHEVSLFKQNIKSQLKENGYSEASQIFIAALALGDRTDFTQEMQETLSAAGVLHLFAISGLHVGIIFWLILQLLYPLLYLSKGRIIRIIAALILIWVFAAFVNFTPSVTRAAFMISFYYLTFLSHRPTNIFHTLFFTAFVLLFINPNDLFDVGFQLSYSAVFFIAWLYRPIRMHLPIYMTRWKNYIFNIMSVTVAAQIGVMPIAVFYFGQFSGLFIVGNLLLIPMAGFLVGLSMLSVVLISLNLDFSFYIIGVNTAFNCILWLIEYIATFESMILDNLSISMFQLFILLGIVLCLKPLLTQFKWIHALPLLTLILLFQMTKIHDNYTFSQKQEFIIFNQYKGSIIGIRNGNILNIFQSVEDSAKAYKYVIEPYVLHQKIDSIAMYDLNESMNTTWFMKEKNLIKWHNNLFYLVNQKMDSLPNVDYIIGSKGKINAHTYIPKRIKRVIADGSNYPSVIKRLTEKSDQIHATATSGAFILTADSINH